MTEETLRFIQAHRTDDVRTLALQAARYPEVDMPTAITQIAGRQAARLKVPTWADNDGILYPAHLSMEQCSSEVTARYKASIVQALGAGGTLTDLTGGFGIDCSFLSTVFAQAVYVERQETLCRLARHNFGLLGQPHIRVVHADAVTSLEQMEEADWIFIDPARRDSHGGKTVAIADCEPDVQALEELLLRKARRVMVKLSPMLDLTLALHDLRHVAEAHIVSVANECKELLLVLQRDLTLAPDEVPVTCVNLHTDNAPFRFTRTDEQSASCSYTARPKRYLYEPNASLLKGGAYRSLAHAYGLEKLHPSSHLYTGDELLPRFPGRKFEVTGCCGFGKKDLKTLKILIGEELKANLTVRNFPDSVATLRKKLKLKEGGDNYLFATTLCDNARTLICCKPVC